jgi:hypothetical protein
MPLPTEPVRVGHARRTRGLKARTEASPAGRVQTETGTPSRDQTATGTTVLNVKEGLITEEVGLDDGISVLEQLGLIAQS